MAKTKKLGRKENIVGLLCVLPSFASLLLFALVPIVMSVYISFTSWTGFNTMASATWVGLQNYKDIFVGVYRSDFLKAIWNTVFLMIGIPVCLFLALLLATALNKKIPGSEFFRVIYYLPAVTSVVAVTIVFDKLFRDPGAVNQLLNTFGISSLKWRDDPYLAKVIIIALSVWGGLGYMTLLYLAGLQGISKDVYEAATLDGANGAQVFFKITMPLIRPVTFFLVVTNIMGGLQKFSEPTVLFPPNGRGPQKGTQTIMVFLYYHFSTTDKLGIASAIAWILGIMIFVITAVQFYINGRRNSDV